MEQFLADQIDQMDLAIDQLAIKDRNFDRFALMLIDNVVELTLHRYAQDKSKASNTWMGKSSLPSDYLKIINNALGQKFNPKITLAKHDKILSDEEPKTIQSLHNFRNTAYHAGNRHEGILHSVALFYFHIACSVLSKYSHGKFLSNDCEKYSHRVIKYLGKLNVSDERKSLQLVWERLIQVADSMGDTLVADLHDDMEQTINSSDKNIQFLADALNEKKTRQQAIIDCQAWSFAFSDEGKKFARENNYPQSSLAEYVDWIGKNYHPWQTKTDPIPNWRSRLDSLKNEKNPHKALEKYCQLKEQTEKICEQLNNAAASLDVYIDHLTHEALDRRSK